MVKSLLLRVFTSVHMNDKVVASQHNNTCVQYLVKIRQNCCVIVPKGGYHWIKNEEERN